MAEPRQPDPEAEMNVLGEMMFASQNGRAEEVRAVVKRLNRDDFSSWSNGAFFAAAARLHEDARELDTVALKRALQESGEYEKAGGADTLSRIVEHAVTSANLVSEAEIVKRISVERRFAFIMQSAATAGSNGKSIPEVRSALEKALDDLQADERTTSSPFLTVKELETAAPDVDWVWGGYLPMGAFAVIVGQPKAGKSTMIYALIAAMEKGEPFLGQAVHKGPTVYLSEEPGSAIYEKMRRFGIKEARVLGRGQAYPRKPLAQRIDEAMEVAADIGAKTIVVDTWGFWAGLPPDGERNEGVVSEALEPILRAAGAGFTVLIIHHTNKLAPGAIVTVDSVRGSSALAGNADCVMALVRTKNLPFSGVRKLHAWSRYEDTPEEVTLSLQGSNYLLHDSDTDLKSDKIMALIIETVHRQPGISQKDLFDTLTASKPVKTVAAQKAIAAKTVFTSGRGVRGDPFLYFPCPSKVLSGFESNSGSQVQTQNSLPLPYSGPRTPPVLGGSGLESGASNQNPIPDPNSGPVQKPIPDHPSS